MYFAPRSAPNIARACLGALLTLSLALALAPLPAFGEDAKELAVSPAVIDEKAEARDILNKSIIVTNTSNRTLTLYPTVDDVNPQDGSQAFNYAGNANERSDSLANWIEFSRGVINLGPGEQKELPLVIRVNMNAVPNMYHAYISFYEGGNRDDAQRRPPLNAVTVNLEVKADIKELMQLNTFATDNVVFTGDDVVFKYQLQNIGNQELHPSGEISIYNRKGEEIASIDVNKEGKTISPDQTTQLASVWSGVSGFGRYKALLTVNYGGQEAAVQDTVFFWVIPWKQLLGLFIVSITMVIFFALYFQQWFEDRHLHKLAHAGFLKHEVAAHVLPDAAHRPLPAPQEAPTPAPAPRKGRLAAIASKAWPLKKKSLEPIASAQAPAPALAPIPMQQSAAVSVATREGSSHGSTIDLKTLREREKERAAAISQAHGHVINLKNNQ